MPGRLLLASTQPARGRRAPSAKTACAESYPARSGGLGTGSPRLAPLAELVIRRLGTVAPILVCTRDICVP